MPTLPSVASVLKIGLVWQIGSDLEAFTNIHAHYSGTAPDNASCAVIAQAVHTSVVSHLQSHMTTNRAIIFVRVTDLTTPSSGIGEYHSGILGTSGGAPLPDSIGMLARHTIARRYRGGKPKSFTPLGAATDLDPSGDFNAAALATVNTAWVAFWASLITITNAGTSLDRMVSISYFSGSTWQPHPPPANKTVRVPTLRVAPVIDDITATALSPRPGSQRRRNFAF